MGWTRDTVIKVAKRTGYPVVEAWSSKNAGAMGTVYGPIMHHTGTSSTAAGDYPTLKVVRDGRPGLENSLCMYGIGRSGTIYCVSEKISWHAGVGVWNGITDGNGHFAGIEAEGPYTTWPAAELDSYQRLVASILLETGRGLDWAPTHAQFATPAGRKTDPQGFNVPQFKSVVQGYLNNPGSIGGGDDMYDENARQELLSLLNEIRRLSGLPVGWGGGVESEMIAVRKLWGEGLTVDSKAIGTQVAAQVAPLLANQLKTISDADLVRIKTAVADEIDARNRDGNPKTGQLS